MKKTKILTVVGVLLAMGITACGGNKSSATPAPSSSSSQPAPSSSSSAPSSSSSVAPTPTKDATGHIWGADADVAASGEGVAYKKATCTEGDQFIRLTVNQSAVTYASGSSRKEGTPDGYTKLTSNNQSMSFKFNYDSYAEGTLYLFGCMDGWGSSSNHSAGFYYQGSPNLKITINGEEVDVSGSQSGSYAQWFGGDDSTDSLSPEGYAPVGSIALENGVNELVYTRVQTLNMLIKDFVFVVKNGTKPAHEHTADAEWHKDASGHWHECTAGDGYKMNSEAHSFGEWAETPSAQPCKEKGSKSRTCSVCGFVETGEIDLADHTWVADESKTDVPATCIAGKHYEKCSVCGETRETAIPKDPTAAHTFGEWSVVTEATCAQGQKKRVCSLCGLEDFAVIEPLDGATHQWGEKTTVPAVTHVDDSDPDNPKTVVDYAGYEKQVCSVCGTWKVSMKVADATLGEGSTLKADDFANTGGYKLKSNNNYFEFKLKFETIADVKIYQLGCMDNWHSDSNNNRERTYHSGASGDNCNFKFTVNGKDIEIDPATANAKAEDLVPDRADDDPLKTITCPSGGTGYSAYAELLIGEAELVKGDNTLRYTRLASYNYIVSDLIFEVTPFNHEHVAGENWVDTDDTYHWKNCTHSDGHKMDKAKHDYTGAEWEVVTPSTCTVKGTHRRACIVCGYWQVEEMDLAAHDYVGGDVTADGTKGSQTLTCSVCGDTKTVTGGIYSSFKFGDATQSDGATLDSGKFKASSTYKLAVLSVPADGTYVLTLPMKGSSGNGTRVINGSSNSGQGFTLYANGQKQVFYGDGKTYEEFIGADQTVWVNVAFGEVQLKAGYNLIEIVTNSGGYRLSLNADSNITLAPKE